MGRRNSGGAVFLPLKTRKRLNAPPADQAWGWFTHELLESGAMRSLSINGRRVIDRIRLEHMAHAGLENGRLKVTWLDFEKFGINRRRIKSSIEEVTTVGIVAIEQPGRKAWGNDQGDSTQYRLTYLPVADPGDYRPATNDWRRFGSNVKAAKAASKRKAGNGKGKAKFQAWPMPP
jgi:hypothetical protein